VSRGSRMIAILRNLLGTGLAWIAIGFPVVLIGLALVRPSNPDSVKPTQYSWPQPRFFAGQTIHLKPGGEPALVVKSQCWPWWGCQYRLRLVGQTESWFRDSDPALP
jgi:hypothetical protein